MVVALLPGAAAAQVAEPAIEAGGRERRLVELESQITRYERELDDLADHEQGVLGNLDHLGAELRLRQAEYDEASLRLDRLSDRIAEHDASVSLIESAQTERRRYLAFRLREVYKAGDKQWLRRLIDGEAFDSYWQGLNYASYLSQRDGQVLEAYRSDATTAEQERAALDAARANLKSTQGEQRQARDAVSMSRRRQAATLDTIRQDKKQRHQTLEELRQAADELSGLIDSLDQETSAPGLDMRVFKGDLDQPSEGRVSSGFGTVVHPRFGTKVPHPGWDIDAPFGANIATVFDGLVVFSDWMRGYGLTAIVDHGGGMLSIYAHASVLVVQKGQQVHRGQLLGKVGDTGSLRGPYLYFELRRDGQPIDPRAWIRPR